MSITFTPLTVNEHDNGAKLGLFENSVNVNAGYEFYYAKPDIFKIVGNELFLEDTWHYDFETQIFYDYTNGVTLNYPIESLTQLAFKDSGDDTQWTLADISLYEDIAELNVTPLDFASLEAGATVATILTGSSADTFLLTDNPFVTISGNDIKLVDNMYYDLGTTNFHSGSSFWDPSASSGQISISGVQNGKINEKTLFDYSSFLQNIVSGAQNSSAITFSAVPANEHENGALLGAFSHATDSGGTYSFATSKPSMLKIIGNQLFLEESYHFDSETSSFYQYTLGNSGGISWNLLGPYIQEELSWRVKYQADDGSEAFIDVPLSFSDINEAITITPVAFDSLEVGATVATISNNSSVNSDIQLGENSYLIVDGTDVKLANNYYYNAETSKFHSGDTYFDPVTASGELSLVSKQTGLETINYYDGLDYSTFFETVVSLAQYAPLTYYASGGTETKQKTGTNSIDALLYDDVQVHSSDKYYANTLTDLANDTTVITYSFSALNSANAQYVSGYDEGNAQVTELNLEQRESVQKALAEWEKVANIRFHEVEETGNLVGTIRFAFTDFSDSETEGFWGWARSPSEMANSGDIWISSDQVDEINWQPGSSYNFMSLMHEIGHALGLAHPFSEEGSGSTDVLPASKDVRNYSIMSYTNPSDDYFTYAENGDYQYLISSTPMVYDIAAIQYLYGPATNNTGDTTFTYVADQPFVEAIWDSSGNDTLDLSNFLEACTVSLVPGAYSTIACTNWSMTDNFGIAHGSIIENVTGGAGGDTIIGNDSNNIVIGGAGDDILTGGAGLDSFRFLYESGSDTVTDFSVTDDNLMFFDSGGVEINSSSLIESNNDAGDVVLTASNGSNVTLQGISTYSLVVPSLNGTVKSNSGTVLENVVVKGFDLNGNEVASTVSDVSGQFSFNTTEDITLTIEKDFANNNIVTVRDALDALKLSIGMTKSDGTINPLDFIAADMNQDGKVSVRDALDILKYSLNMESSTAHWKFVPEDLDTSNISRSAVTYDNSLSVDFSEIQSEHSFLGILVGDVNGTV